MTTPNDPTTTGAPAQPEPTVQDAAQEPTAPAQAGTADRATQPTATPDTGARFSVRTDRRLIRSLARSDRYLLVDVVAPTVAPDPARRRPPVNLAFVLDRSGSMSGRSKLDLAKQAVLESIHRLDVQDRFSVVMFDDQVDVVIPGAMADPGARRHAADRLRPVQPGGSTNLHGGWLTGCGQVAAALAERGVNRVLLLTDGLANVGVADGTELARQALDLRTRGVTTSTFGVGRDFDEELLHGMADSGGGNFYFIGDVAQMRDHITSEVGDTLEVVARDVQLELVVPLGVHVDAVTPFRVERVGELVRVFLGDLVSGQVVQVALRLQFETGVIGLGVDAVVRITDRDTAFRTAGIVDPVTVGWSYADHEANDTQARDQEVDRFVVRIRGERGKLEASRLNREGRYGEAESLMRRVEGELAPLAAADPSLREVINELRADAIAYAGPMDAMELKARHFRSVSLSHARTAEGKPVKPAQGKDDQA